MRKVLILIAAAALLCTAAPAMAADWEFFGIANIQTQWMSASGDSNDGTLVEEISDSGVDTDYLLSDSDLQWGRMLTGAIGATVSAGDIIAIAGLKEASVADTIGAPELETPVASIPVDPPTLAMTFSINDSPLDGDRDIALGLAVEPGEDETSFEVRGRGELQLGVLIETLRREGFELSVSLDRDGALAVGVVVACVYEMFGKVKANRDRAADLEKQGYPSEIVGRFTSYEQQLVTEQLGQSFFRAGLTFLGLGLLAVEGVAIDLEAL